MDHRTSGELVARGLRVVLWSILRGHNVRHAVVLALQGGDHGNKKGPLGPLIFRRSGAILKTKLAGAHDKKESTL